MLELNLCLILLLSCKNELRINQRKFDLSLFYFIVQSFGRMILVFCFFFSDFSSIEFAQALMVRALCIKMGLWPVHWWFYKFRLISSTFILFLMLTIQKIPLYGMLLIRNQNLVIILFIFNMLMGLGYLFYSKGLFHAMISSSLYIRVWILLFFNMSISVYLFFFSFYRVLIFFVCTINESLDFLYNSSIKFILLTFSIFFLSLPPISIFFFKLSVLVCLITTFNLAVWFIVWVLSFGSLIAYLFIFLPMLIERLNLFRSVPLVVNSYSLPLFGLLFSVVFLI